MIFFLYSTRSCIGNVFPASLRRPTLKCHFLHIPDIYLPHTEEAFAPHIRHILPSLRATPLRMFLFSYLSFYHLQLYVIKNDNYICFLKEIPTTCYDKFSYPIFSKLLKRFYPIAITKNIIIIIIVDAQ